MTRLVSLFPILTLFLLSVHPAGAHSYVEKNRHKLRVVQQSENGTYELCQLAGMPGFCIVGCGQNDGILLGYSPQGDLHKALSNESFRLLLRSYELQPTVVNSPRLLPQGLPESAGPLLTDSWNQPEPYNICTPMLDGKHCQVGCVALAMAQVMRYWQYPARGVGQHTYTDSTGCGMTLSADFSHPYSWELMRDVYDGAADSSDVSLLAAGTLMGDCGIAVNMRYGLEASAARTVSQPIALHQWFGYDAGMQLHFRDFYSRAEWEGMLYDELAAGRPVLISAQSTSLSHAFVCDGYDEDGLFHMNFGLGGDADGYYYLPYLTPDQPKWHDAKSPEGGLNLLQSIVTGVRPATGYAVVRHSFGMSSIQPVAAVAARHDVISLVTNNLANVGWNDVEPDSVQLVLLQQDSVLCAVSGYGHPFLLEELADSSYTDTLSFAVPMSLPAGRYRVQPAVHEDDGTWTMARTSIGTPSCLILDVQADSVRLQADASRQARLELLSWQFPDTVQRFQQPVFSFRIRNAGPSEYCGRFSVLLRNVGNPEQYRVLQCQGLWLSSGECTERTFRRTYLSVPEGDYELHLAYDSNLFTDSMVWMSQEPLQVIHVAPPVPSSIDAPVASKQGIFRYGLDGRMTNGRQPGVIVEWRNGKYRKIVTNKRH